MCNRWFDGTRTTLSLYDSSDRTRRLSALTWWNRHDHRSIARWHHRTSKGRSGDFRWPLHIFVRRLRSSSDQMLDQDRMVWATQTSDKSEGKTDLLNLIRDNDIFLTEQFLVKGYPKSHLGFLNWCRLYLRVTTHSDITSGDGCYLLPYITQCHNPLQHYSSI